MVGRGEQGGREAACEGQSVRRGTGTPCTQIVWCMHTGDRVPVSDHSSQQPSAARQREGGQESGGDTGQDFRYRKAFPYEAATCVAHHIPPLRVLRGEGRETGGAYTGPGLTAALRCTSISRTRKAAAAAAASAPLPSPLPECPAAPSATPPPPPPLPDGPAPSAPLPPPLPEGPASSPPPLPPPPLDGPAPSASPLLGWAPLAPKPPPAAPKPWGCLWACTSCGSEASRSVALALRSISRRTRSLLMDRSLQGRGRGNGADGGSI